MSIMHCCDEMESALITSAVKFDGGYKLNEFHPDLVYCPWCGAKLEETGLMKRAQHLRYVIDREFSGITSITIVPEEEKIIIHVRAPGESTSLDIPFPMLGPIRYFRQRKL